MNSAGDIATVDVDAEDATRTRVQPAADAGYARQESHSVGLRISVTCVLPVLTPATELGRLATVAYAAQMGMPEAQFLQQMGEPLTPEAAGSALVRLGSGEDEPTGADVLGAGGLRTLADATPAAVSATATASVQCMTVGDAGQWGSDAQR